MVSADRVAHAIDRAQDEVVLEQFHPLTQNRCVMREMRAKADAKRGEIGAVNEWLLRQGAKRLRLDLDAHSITRRSWD
jgi:hypothetical protein